MSPSLASISHGDRHVEAAGSGRRSEGKRQRTDPDQGREDHERHQGRTAPGYASAQRSRNVGTGPPHWPDRTPFRGGMSRMTTEIVTFGAGCFWGVEYVFERVPGVLRTDVGYEGGTTENPTYRDVCSHTTGHVEVARVTFDPSVVTFDQLLEVFWAMHDPTQVDRQGPDVGDQYRSVIFIETDEQRLAAETSKERAQGRFPRPIATTIEPAKTFYA